MDNIRSIFVDRFTNVMGNNTQNKKIETSNISNTPTNSNLNEPSQPISISPIFTPFVARARSMSESSSSDESIVSCSNSLDQNINGNNVLNKKESEAYFWIMWRS